jgi:Domain of unknown function (DUF4349)
MSQRDLTAELRAAHTPVPPELRERVRLCAAAAPQPRRSRLPRIALLSNISWRRALVVAVPVAAAVAATLVVTRPSHHPTAGPLNEGAHFNASTPSVKRAAVPFGTATKSAGTATKSAGASTPLAPSPKRLQSYGATLTLREPDQQALSRATQRAQQIVGSLSGYARTISVTGGTARLVLAVPRTHVQGALARLGKLGTIVGESVHVQDLQAGANATDRTIARLQRQLRTLRTQTQTPKVQRQIAAVTAHVQRLQRQQAATARKAHYATIELRLATRRAAAPVHHGHGPLHGLGIAFRWTGIGLVYGLAFGVPLALLWLLIRWVRRRRDDALISRA